MEVLHTPYVTGDLFEGNVDVPCEERAKDVRFVRCCRNL